MELELPKKYQWTNKDQETVDVIYIKSKYYLKWFLIGVLTGMIILGVIYIISRKMDWWGVITLIGVFLQ